MQRSRRGSRFFVHRKRKKKMIGGAGARTRQLNGERMMMVICY